MKEDKGLLVSTILNKTLASINMLKVSNQQVDNMFLPIGVLLLKWINDSRHRLNWFTNFDYRSLIDYSVSKDLSKYIYYIGESLERDNYSFRDLFTKICFNNIEYVDPYSLKEIILSYVDIDFSDDDCEIYITGPVIDEFLRHLGDNFNIYSFITTHSIKKILSQLFKIDKYMLIGDIACGTAGILSEIKSCLDESGEDCRFINLYGQEINFKTSLIAKINLLMHGVINPDIRMMDTLNEPMGKNKLKEFDIILSNLPLGLKWAENQVGYKHEFRYGLPSKSNAEWLFIQRGIEALSSNGKAAFVVSKSTLTRKSEMKIREYILYEDIIETVISLPNNLYGTKTIPVEILVINKNKINRDRILFIDASKYFIKKQRGRNDLSEEQIRKIINTYHDFNEIKGYSKLVHRSEIASNNFELDTSYYTDNELENFKDYKMKELSDVAEIRRGLQVPKERLSNDEMDSHYYIKISDLNNDGIEFNERIGNLSQRELTSFELQPNDILISARGVLIKTAIYEREMPSSVFSGNILLIRLRNDYNPYFLKFYFDSELGKKILASIQEGATIVALNPSKLEHILIPDVDIEKQNEISKMIQYNKKEYEEKISLAQEIYNEKLSSINKEIISYIKKY